MSSGVNLFDYLLFIKNYFILTYILNMNNFINKLTYIEFYFEDFYKLPLKISCNLIKNNFRYYIEYYQ